MKRRRAYSLAAVSALCAVAFLMLLLALDVMMQTYRRGAQAEGYEIALRYANSGFQQALARLRQDSDWGKQPGDSIQVPQIPGDVAGSGAQVRFTTAADNSDRTLSLNRVGLDPATSATGLALPANSVHLVSVGTARGVKATIEGVIAVNPFPFAIASSGPLVSTGSFLVGSLEDPAALDDPVAFQKALKRGSLLSNATGNSISLSGSPVRVTGDVVCVGQATLGSGVTIEGEVKENRQPKPIPEIKLSDFDTAGKEGVRILETNHLTRPEAFEGYVRATGDVEVDGELKLSEAIVYIDGTLTVRGPLSGRGALFVTGEVKLESAALGALDQLALVSGGRLTVSGRGKDTSRLVGLLVSKGDISLSNMTVIGAVVASGGPGNQLKFDNVSMLGSSKGLDFEFDLGWGGKPTTFKLPDDVTRPDGLNRTVFLKPITTSAPTGERPAMPSDFVSRYNPASPDTPLLLPSDFSVKMNDGSTKTLDELGISMVTGLTADSMIFGLQSLALDAARTSVSDAGAGKLSLNLNKFLKIGETLQLAYRRIY